MKGLVVFFESPKGQQIKNLIIGLGASVVIMGALFKLMSWPGAGLMLIVGLGTEAFIFALLGILPPHPDLYWEKFYPGITTPPHLDEMHNEGKPINKPSVTDQLNDMLEKANVETRLIERLGNNLGKLGDTAEKISELGDVAASTSDYAAKTKEASEALVEMKNAYATATANVTALGQTTEDFKAYQEQIESVAKNLASLNSIYEVELSDTTSNLKALNQNLSSLNGVYGNMLSAMGGSRANS
ncbi:MAG: gliding motility protein GldL [Chitinophagales bacterium]